MTLKEIIFPKLNVHSLCEPVIPFLEKWNKYPHTYMHECWQPKLEKFNCPSKDEWKKIVKYLYNGIVHRNKLWTTLRLIKPTWKNLKNMLCKSSQRVRGRRRTYQTPQLTCRLSDWVKSKDSTIHYL